MRNFFFAPPVTGVAAGVTAAGANPGVAAGVGAGGVGGRAAAAAITAAFFVFVDAIKLLRAALFLGSIASASKSPFILSSPERDFSERKEPIYIITLYFSMCLLSHFAYLFCLARLL